MLTFYFLSQIVKLLKIFYDMVTLDIFFIDFERPKYNTCGDHFTPYGSGSHKSSHPGTPSIASSILKPPTSPANYECVSAWRNYFIANEWQELIVKRKISLNLHLLAVIAFLMVRKEIFCVFGISEHVIRHVKYNLTTHTTCQ